MSEKKPQKTLQEVADELRDAAIEYYGTNTEEDEARRQAEEDVRVRAVLAELGRLGKLPPGPPKTGS